VVATENEMTVLDPFKILEEQMLLEQLREIWDDDHPEVESFIDCSNGNECGSVTMQLGGCCYICGAPDWSAA
jgi:hypothetical protein